MFKFVGKLVILVVLVYLLIQIPFFGDYYNKFKTAFDQKIENVANEYNRIRGKVVEVKDKVDATTEKIGDIKDKVVETKDALEDTIDDVKKVTDVLDGVLNGDDEEAPAEEN